MIIHYYYFLEFKCTMQYNDKDITRYDIDTCIHGIKICTRNAILPYIVSHQHYYFLKQVLRIYLERV